MTTSLDIAGVADKVRGMDLRQIRTFCAVAELGSTSRLAPSPAAQAVVGVTKSEAALLPGSFRNAEPQLG